MKRVMFAAMLAAAPAFAAPLAPAALARMALANPHLTVEETTFQGRPALRVVDRAPSSAEDDARVLPLAGTMLADGEIEFDVAGDLKPDASADARGFVGIAFRVGAGRFEHFYLRPTNGRADDQVRRNHTQQYAAHPGFPWHVLRKNEPERYESYADVAPGAWQHVRITVEGRKARFYLNGAAQPALIVNDLKLGADGGLVGLWVGPGTMGHFTNLSVRPLVASK